MQPVAEKNFTATQNLWDSLYQEPPLLGPAVRFVQENTGLTLMGKYNGFFYGNIAGGKKPGAAWDQEILLTGVYDFGFLTPALNGLTLTGSFRWREGQDPNNFVGAPMAFNPSAVECGKYYRLMPVYLTYVTPQLFGVKDFLTISGGWQNPDDFFLQQPLSKLFVNSALMCFRGIGANISAWSCSYTAWGGYLKVKPTDWIYAQAGLYAAIPDTMENHNHGLYFQRGQGLYGLAEVGMTPKIAELPGKYAFGMYTYGANDSAWNQKGPQHGFYWQIDQQLYRADSSPKENSTTTQYIFDKGLYLTSMFTYAPPYNNALPFYFQTGLIYQGLIPARDRDQLGVAYGFGNYYGRQLTPMSCSCCNMDDMTSTAATRQAVVEIDYKIELTKWLSLKPFYQILINPASDNSLRNAHVLGFSVSAGF